MVAMLVLLLLPITLSTLVPLDPRDKQCDGMEGLQCPAGCCPENNWVCCNNWDFCAATYEDCETIGPCPEECSCCMTDWESGTQECIACL